MAKGRKKLPDALKVVQGTFRKHRGKTADSQDETAMVAPESLTEAELAHFERLVAKVEKLGLNSDTYADALVLAAKRMVEVEDCDALIVTHGRVIESETDRGGNPILRPNPAVTMRNEAMRHLQSLLAEFGLTPSSIGRVGGKKKEPEKKQGFGGL